MPRRRYRNSFYRILSHLGKSPVDSLEGLQFIVLGWALWKTLTGFGGFLAFAEPMVGVSASLFVLAVLHALVVLFRDERKGLDWEALLPVPFLAYAWLHYRYLSPVPFEASLFLAALVQAFAVYLIVFNSIHGHRSGNWLLTICILLATGALLAGLFQYYLYPEWMVTLDRERNPDYQHGASGFLMDPANLGGLLLPLWPLVVAIAVLRRFHGTVRILCASLAILMAVGLLLSLPRPAFALLLILIALFPFFLAGSMRRKRRQWGIILASLIILAPLMWFSSGGIHERLDYLIHFQPDPLETTSCKSALSAFLENPLTGTGMGTTGQFWESYRTTGVTGTSRYVVSGFLGILAELGLTGIILVFLPVMILLVRGFLAWRRYPFSTDQPDPAELDGRMAFRRGRRKRRKEPDRPVPSFKVILGGLLSGLAAAFLYNLFDYAIRLPVQLFLMGCLFAALAAYSRSCHRKNASSAVGLMTGFVPLLLVTWSIMFGLPRFYSQYLVYTTDEKLAYQLEQPDRIFKDPGILTLIAHGYNRAVELSPDNAEALVGTGRTWLAGLHAGLWPATDLGLQATDALGRALELNPDSWIGHFEMARAICLTDRPMNPALSHLRMAIALAPNRVEPAGLLGGLLLLEDPQSSEGLVLVERAIGLDPEYEPVKDVLRWARTRGGGSIPSFERVVSRRFLAEQFELIPAKVERVLGAGIMSVPEEILPLPDPEKAS